MGYLDGKQEGAAATAAVTAAATAKSAAAIVTDAIETGVDGVREKLESSDEEEDPDAIKRQFTDKFWIQIN